MCDHVLANAKNSVQPVAVMEMSFMIYMYDRMADKKSAYIIYVNIYMYSQVYLI